MVGSGGRDIRDGIGGKDDNTNIQCDKEIIATHFFHNLCIRSYFMRLSCKNKKKFLAALVDRIKSIESLLLLIQTLYGGGCKESIYKKVEKEDNFPLDRVLNDHNRMLDDRDIEDTMDKDIEWYSELTDNDQVSLLIHLVGAAYSSIPNDLYVVLKKRLNRRYNYLVKIPQITIVTSQIEKDDRSVDKNKNEVVGLGPTKHNLKDPRHVACERKIKKYNKKFAKYQKKVDAMYKKLNKKRDNEQDSKSSKKGKKHNKEKTKKKKKKKKEKKSSSKGSKKSKGKKSKIPEGNDTLDYIQIMPVWISMKIFSYLDLNTLKKIKKVNKHWRYIVEQLQKERKTRKYLDKTFEKLGLLENNLPNSNVGPLQPSKERVSFIEKRIRRCMKRGAILKSLRHTNEPLVTYSILQSAVASRHKEYIAPVLETTTYPRVVPTKPQLYSTPKCLIKDLNMIQKEIRNYCERSAESVTSSYVFPENDSRESHKRTSMGTYSNVS